MYTATDSFPSPGQTMSSSFIYASTVTLIVEQPTPTVSPPLLQGPPWCRGTHAPGCGDYGKWKSWNSGMENVNHKLINYRDRVRRPGGGRITTYNRLVAVRAGSSIVPRLTQGNSHDHLPPALLRWTTRVDWHRRGVLTGWYTSNLRFKKSTLATHSFALARSRLIARGDRRDLCFA
jgi:hypothetical protein